MTDITLNKSYEVTRNGATVEFDPSKVSKELLGAIFAHGLAAKVGDAAASATAIAGESKFGKPKKEVNASDWKAWVDSPAGEKAIGEIAQEAMAGVLDALYEGNWTQRGGGVSRARLPDDMALAVRNAKADLLVMFKRLTGKGKIADMVDHKKIAPYFNTAGDNVVWLDESVQAWIEKQAEAGKRDYVAEAKAALSVDLDDLDL